MTIGALLRLREVPVAPLAEKCSPMPSAIQPLIADGDTTPEADRPTLPGPQEEDRVQFALSPEQSLLKDAMDAFIGDHAGTERRRSDRLQPRGYSADSWRSLAELGVLGVPFAADEGGLGGGPRELITVMESLGRGLCIEPVL